MTCRSPATPATGSCNALVYPTLNCDLGPLAAGASTTVQVRYLVPATVANGTQVTYTASVGTANDPATANKYRITPSGGSYAKTAGAGFNVVVTAYDAYDNVATTYNSSDTLTFTWSGTTGSRIGGTNAAVLGAA